MSRVLRDIARPDGHAGNAVLTRGGPAPRVLVCLESRSPSSVRALLRAACATSTRPTSPSSPRPASTDLLPEGPWTESTSYAPDLVAQHTDAGSLVLSTGHYLPLGALAHRAAEPGRFLTVQHGLLTPHAPPLGAGTILLAWSEADAAFWRSGRDDVGSVVVGSQLLWEAAEPSQATTAPDAPPGLPRPAARRRAAPRRPRTGRRDLLPVRARHLPAAPLRARPPLGGDARPLGEGRHRHRPFRHPAARARRPRRQRVLHRRARGRSGRAARVGHPGRPAALAAGVLGPLRPRAVGWPTDGSTRTARGGAVPRRRRGRAGDDGAVRILCVVPARGGSKGVPRKNLRLVGGKPLIVWTLEQALSARPAMDVVVSTDDEEIAAVARAAGALVPFLRPAELARDTTPTEPVVRHAIAAAREADAAPDAVMLLQATSPVRLPGTLSRALAQLDATGVDSLVGVVPQAPFIWTEGTADARTRPRPTTSRPAPAARTSPPPRCATGRPGRST